MNALQLPPLSLYIHIPWCERKCPYCDFNSHESPGKIPEGDYVRALLEDLEQDLPAVQGREIESVFIGGGTPSLFSVAGVRALLAGVRERVELAEAAEITLEANPGSAEADKFAGFVDAGVNRVSLGVQSLQDNCLAALGRVHNREQALTAIGQLRDCGLRSYNVDLMHGLPGQTATEALADLEAAIGAGAGNGATTTGINTGANAETGTDGGISADDGIGSNAGAGSNGRAGDGIGSNAGAGSNGRAGDGISANAGAGSNGRADVSIAPPHISWYQLTIEPNTRFHNKPPALPEEPVLAEIQESGERTLRAEGYDNYEVSAWSRPGHRCRHNLNYWAFGDYIGIGAGAHGKLSFPAENRILRTARRRQPQEYLRPGNTGRAADRQLAQADRIGEYMMNALRLTEGFDLGDFEARTGAERSTIEGRLDTLEEKGAISRDDRRVRTTDLGRRHLDSVTAEFF